MQFYNHLARRFYASLFGKVMHACQLLTERIVIRGAFEGKCGRLQGRISLVHHRPRAKPALGTSRHLDASPSTMDLSTD